MLPSIAFDNAHLQSAIQGKLEQHGYSEAGDPVMAEYVTVMLANSKTSEQITAELSELIGPDYEASFTEWIFDSAIPEYYTKKVEGGATGGDTSPAAVDAAPEASSSSNAAEPTQFQVNSIQTVQDSRDHQRGGFRQGGNRHDLPNRPHGAPTGPRGGQQQHNRGNGVFGSAITGLKREGDQSLERPNRRQRLSDQNGGEGGANGGGDRSIFDRAGVRAGQPPFAGRRGQRNHMMQQQQQQPMFGGPQFAPQVVPGSVIQSGIPGLPPLHIPHNFNALPPAQQQAIQQQIFQHQLIAAAAANQLFQPQGPLMQQQQQQQPFPVQSPEAPQAFQQGSAAGQQQHQPRKSSKPVRLPDRPSSEELCKYGVDCRNAICKYSHPSPAATKESGLVLSKDVCEKNLECDDKVSWNASMSLLRACID